MKRKTAAQLLVFIIGGLLFIFSIELPVLGFKKLEFIEETSTREVISYNWYGKGISEQTFQGEPKEALSLFPKARQASKKSSFDLCVWPYDFALWWSREKKRYIYGSAFLVILFVVIRYYFGKQI